MPTYTSPKRAFDLVDASSTERLIESIVNVMLVTTPRVTPSDSDFPYPRISILPNSFFLPTMVQIFVVPISRPTTMSLLSVLFLGPGSNRKPVLLFSIRCFFGADYLIFKFQIDCAVFIPSLFTKTFFVKQKKFAELFIHLFFIAKNDGMISNARNQFHISILVYIYLL